MLYVYIYEDNTNTNTNTNTNDVLSSSHSVLDTITQQNIIDDNITTGKTLRNIYSLSLSLSLYLSIRHTHTYIYTLTYI